MAKSLSVIRGGANHIVFASHDGTGFTVEHTLNNVVSSPAARQADGTYQVTITQAEDSEALETFLEDFRVNGAAASTTSIVYEDGDEDVAPAGDNINYLYIFQYSKPTDETPAKRRVFVGRGYIDATSGSYEQANGSYSNPSIVFKTVKEPKSGGLTIAADDFAASLVTGASKSLPEGSTGKKFFLAKA